MAQPVPAAPARNSSNPTKRMGFIIAVARRPTCRLKEPLQPSARHLHMKHLSLLIRSALCVALLGLGVSVVSCGGEDGGTTPDANTGTPDAGGTATTGTYNHYATNTLKLGTSPGEATALAFNIDGKPGN